MDDILLIDDMENGLARILRPIALCSATLKLKQILIVLRRIGWRTCLGGIGRGCTIYPYVVVHSPKMVFLGENVSVAEFVHIWGGGGVKVGNSVMVGLIL